MHIEGPLVRDQGGQLLEFDAFPQLLQPSSHLMVEVEHFRQLPQLIVREVPSLSNLREDLEHVGRLPVDFVDKEFGFAKQAMLKGTLQILKEALRLLSVDLGHEFSAQEVEGVIPLV
jgi:hypothetical protein